MTADEKRIRERYLRHLRRTKWWLRRLPRKAHLHRYPVLKWFATAARKRAYLWSLRPEAIVPALYAGFLITFQPIIGIQIPLALVLALILRANLPVMLALQLLSTPLTVPFLYPFQYYLGMEILHLFADHGELREATLEAIRHTPGRFSGFADAYRAISLGGAMLGWICGATCAILYRVFSARTVQAFKDFRQHRQRKKAAAAADALAADPEQVPLSPDFKRSKDM